MSIPKKVGRPVNPPSKQKLSTVIYLLKTDKLALRKRAEEENMSLSGYINYVLRKHLRRRETYDVERERLLAGE